MSKQLMYVAALVLSVIIASCATQYQSQGVAGGDADAANALQRARAAYDRQDYVTALRELRPLAQQGNAPAQNNLGFMYMEGRGVTQDDAEAVRLYRQAAAQGNAYAYGNLGLMYAEGRGVTQDNAEAVRLYRQAAAQGNTMGQNNLGFMYMEGRGVTQDDAEAVRLYRQAATQGYALAQYNLGVRYEQGRGVTRDLAEASRLFAKAAEHLPSGKDRDMAVQGLERVEHLLTTPQATTALPASATPPTPVSAAPLPASFPIPPPASAPSHTMDPQNTVTPPLTQSLDNEKIALVKKGGVYRLPVEINSVITLHFVLDTGAADVQIPADVTLTLIRTGTIREADFLPGVVYTLADGSTVKSPRFLLRSLKIGNRRVANVAASIGSISSELLLGQSFLEKLGTWGIDNQRQILTLSTQGQRK
jgi:hypothetical protein